MSQVSVTGKISKVSPPACIMALIALGSNLNFDGGGPAAVLDSAYVALEKRGVVIRKRSRYYHTPAFPAGAGPDFVNAAAMVEAQGDAQTLLAKLHEVEAEMGRARAVRWGARTLDLDLIAVEGQVHPDVQTHQYWCDLPLELQKTAVPDQLIVPHPRLSERGFVLVPLMDVAPDWRHPVTGRTVKEMHDDLTGQARAEVVAL